MEHIFEWNLPPKMQHLANIILLWLGFALLVGLLAQLIVPNKKTRGTLITLVVGLTGSCLGSLGVSQFYVNKSFNPIGVVGFVVSVCTSILLLGAFYLISAIFPPKKPPDKK